MDAIKLFTRQEMLWHIDFVYVCHNAKPAPRKIRRWRKAELAPLFVATRQAGSFAGIVGLIDQMIKSKVQL